MSQRKNCASPLEAARAEVEALGQQLDDLEALSDWTPAREAERQDLITRYLAARRRARDLELEEDLG